MINVRWYKAMRDLWINKARTMMVIAAIAIGTMGLGSILNAYSILTREIQSNYLGTNPASFTLWTDNIDDRFLQFLRANKDIQEVELRKTVVARIQTKSDIWRTMHLFVIEDYANIHVDKFKSEQGTWPPRVGEILIERDAFSIGDAKIGEQISVKIPESGIKTLKVSGSVHAPGLAPASMENIAYGFISRETLSELGDSSGFNELRVVVATNPMDQTHIRSVAFGIKEWSKKNGYSNTRIVVPEPGKHPHVDQLTSFLFILQVFGILALISSGVLVVNMIGAMMAGQIKQIGIMKTLGAQTNQIMGIYLGMMFLLGLIATGIGIPLGIWLGKAYAGFAASVLNFNITDDTIPLWVYAVQVVVGLLVPIFAASFPIRKGSRATVNQAINDYGINGSEFGLTRLDKMLEKVHGLGRPLLLSIRNTFRKKGRLLFTFSTLMLGGVLFIVSFNARESLNNTVQNAFEAKKHDIEIKFSVPYPIEDIEKSMQNVEGIAVMEAWGGSTVSRVKSDGTEGNPLMLAAIPANSKLIRLSMIEGRWLSPDVENGVVINHTFLDKEPDLKVGDKLTLNVNSKQQQWKVIGIAREVGETATVYVNNDYYKQLTGQQGSSRDVYLKTTSRDQNLQLTVVRSLESKFKSAGIDVLEIWNVYQIQKQMADHFQLVISFLVMMSFLTIIIGGIGLAITMSINVLERIREIGIMRSMGASTSVIIRIILFEGMFIGLLSWLFACLISIPLSSMIGNMFGDIFLKTTLDTVYSSTGLFIWLIIILVITSIASFIPAWKASQLPVSEVLAHE